MRSTFTPRMASVSNSSHAACKGCLLSFHYQEQSHDDDGGGVHGQGGGRRLGVQARGSSSKRQQAAKWCSCHGESVFESRGGNPHASDSRTALKQLWVAIPVVVTMRHKDPNIHLMLLG
jgi:hypothetical protein